MFIYKALLESITCGMTEIETQNLRIKINQLSTKEKTGQTGFDKQFQVMKMFNLFLHSFPNSGFIESVSYILNSCAIAYVHEMNNEMNEMK